MKVAAAIFVKTPGLSPIKTRLAREIGELAALDFYSHSSECAAEVLARSRCASYWAVAETEALGANRWSREGFGVIEQGQGGLGERLDRVYRALLGRADAAILLGADCPTLSVAELDSAAAALAADRTFVLGPATDGGFYLFGGKRAIPSEIWLTTPYSSANTADRLESGLMEVAAVHRLETRSDVDEAVDLRRLHEALSTSKDPVPAQKRLFSWLESHFSS